MGKDFAVKHQQLVAFSASAIDNKMYTEITKNRIAEETCGKDFPNKRRSSLYSSGETSRKLFCGGEEHDEEIEKQDLSKDELNDKSTEFDWQNGGKITNQIEVGTNVITCKKDLANYYIKVTSASQDIKTSSANEDNKTSSASQDKTSYSSTIEAGGCMSSSFHQLNCPESGCEEYIGAVASDNDVCSYPSSMGFEVDAENKWKVEWAYSDTSEAVNINTQDSSFDLSKHLSSLIARDSAYCIDQDYCPVLSLISSITNANPAQVTPKEMVIMMQGIEKILKCTTINVHSKNLVNFLLKTFQNIGSILSKEKKCLNCEEVANSEKDMQCSEKEDSIDGVDEKTAQEEDKIVAHGRGRECEEYEEKPADTSVIKNDPEKEKRKSLPDNISVKLQRKVNTKTEKGSSRMEMISKRKIHFGEAGKRTDVKIYQRKSCRKPAKRTINKEKVENTHPRGDEKSITIKKETVKMFKRKSCCGKGGKRTSVTSKNTWKSFQRKAHGGTDVLATFAVLPTKKVVNINNVTYKVRACAEKNSGGNKSGGSPGMGGGRSGKKQNSDKDDFSEMGRRNGDDDKEDKYNGDRNVNRQTEPTQPPLNMASLPPHDYKAYKKKHSSVSMTVLCDILGTLGLECHDRLTVNESMLNEVNHCLTILLHTVTQQLASVDCTTCIVLHSLMTHFSISNHRYMECSLCRQIFYLMQKHIAFCTANEIHEERSSSDLCFQITRDPEFQSSLVEEHPERLWFKLLKYLGAILCPSEMYFTFPNFPDSTAEVADANSNTSRSNDMSCNPPSGFGLLTSILPSIPEDNVQKHTPLTSPTSPGASKPSTAAEPLDILDNAMPLIDPITQQPLVMSDKSLNSSLESGSAASEGPSAEQLINKPTPTTEQDDPYATQTKTYGDHYQNSLPVNGPAGSRGSQQLLSLEMRPVGEPGIGEVVYGTRNKLLKVSRYWTEIKNGVEQTGDLHNQLREEGVILAESRYQLKILRTRYNKHDQWQRLVHLGNGMSGKCHLARDVTTGFKFCVKRMHILRYEETELEIWSKVEHTNIVKLFGAIRKGRKVYIFSEFIDGGNLCALIDDHRSLNQRISHWMALQYFRQLLQVLKYLKKMNVIHEDLKSDNILLRRNTTEIVLTDFGLARWWNKEQELQGRAPTGSQPYWSPEKAASMGHGFASDLWAAICILVHMLSGYPPWTRRYPEMQWLHYIIYEHSPPLEDLPTNVQTAVQDLIRSGFVCNAQQRPQVENLLQHQAFCILDQGAPDTCYSILQSSGGQVPNNMLPEDQGDGEDIDKILFSFRQEESTNNLSQPKIRPGVEQNRSLINVSLIIPPPAAEDGQCEPVTLTPSDQCNDLQQERQRKSLADGLWDTQFEMVTLTQSGQYNDRVQESQTGTVGILLPRNQKAGSSDTSSPHLESCQTLKCQQVTVSHQAGESNKSNHSHDEVESHKLIQSHNASQATASQEALKTHDSASDLDCEYDDFESIKKFYEDETPTLLPSGQPKLQPYKPDLGTTRSPSRDQASLLQLMNKITSDNNKNMKHNAQTCSNIPIIILQQHVSDKQSSASMRHPTAVALCKADEVLAKSSKDASEYSFVFYEPVLSGELFGSNQERQPKTVYESEDDIDDQTLHPTASAVTSIDDQLEELDKGKVDKDAHIDVPAVSTNRREHDLHLKVNMKPKKPLRATLSEKHLEPASNYATVRHSETSPASLACLSPSTPSILGDSSGLVTSASSDSRLQTFSEANPSTPCSQFDQQEKEFSDVYRELSGSGLSVEDPEDVLNDKQDTELGPSEDQMLSIHLTKMQQEIQNPKDIGVSMCIVKSNGEKLQPIMVPHNYEDWRSIMNLVREAVHNAGINHFTLKYEDGTEIDFHAKLDKNQMHVVVSEIVDNTNNHHNCWCEDHEDNFRGVA